MKRILFFYPANKRSVSLETLFRELKKRGYSIMFLSMGDRGDLHEVLEQYGIATYHQTLKKGNALIFYIRQLITLVTFCRKHKVDVVFSHLQVANLVAVFANFLIPAKVVAFRHHDFSRTRNEGIGDRIINTLATTIVVPSTGVKNLMLKNEQVAASKLVLLPYIYDFSKYQSPTSKEITAIRNQYVSDDTTLLLIMVARHVPAKRHQLVFQVLSDLKKEGYLLKLLILDEGPDTNQLKTFAKSLNIEKSTYFIGFTRQVTHYLAAADLMLHPSYSEASNSAIKEAGLLEKAVAVCENVGDFSDYIIDEVNGFIMEKENPSSDIKKVIQAVYHNRLLMKRLGVKLKETVISRFSLNQEIIDQYEKLIFFNNTENDHNN